MGIIYKKLVLVLLLFSLFSCEKEAEGYEVPTTYDFENVDYSGQLLRIEMLKELGIYMRSAANQSASALDAQRLKGMYKNEGLPFGNPDLNDETTKQLKSKVDPSVQDTIEFWLDSLAAYSAAAVNQQAAEGQAGVWVDANNQNNRHLVTANGVELAEVIEKTIMGACFYYQATAVYLGSGRMASDNLVVEEGIGTDMEHFWDEAFGYLGVEKDYPSNSDDLAFWGKLVNLRNDILNSNDIMQHFIEGRAAISNDDLERRDEMIFAVRESWAEIAAASVISEINATILAKNNNDLMKISHHLSIAYGLIYGMEYGGFSGMSNADKLDLLNLIGASTQPSQANFYATTIASLEAAKDLMVTLYPSLETVKNQL